MIHEKFIEFFDIHTLHKNFLKWLYCIQNPLLDMPLLYMTGEILAYQMKEGISTCELIEHEKFESISICFKLQFQYITSNEANFLSIQSGNTNIAVGKSNTVFTLELYCR